MGSLGIYIHTVDDVEGMLSRKREEVPALCRSLEGAIELAGRQGLWVPVKNTVATPVTLLRTALAFDVNDFNINSDLCVPQAAGVFPAGALLNHSCTPNCVPLYLTTEEAVKALKFGNTSWGEVPSSASIPGASLAPLVLLFRTVREVGKGEELCHSYVDLALPRARRGDYLLKSYGFVCTCLACIAPPGSISATDHLLLGKSSCSNMPSAEREPLHGLNAGDLPDLVHLGIPSSAVESGESALQNELIGIPQALKRELLTCQELVEAGRFSERPGGHDALSMFQVKLGDADLARVRRAALGDPQAGVSGLGAGEALTLGREVWALEQALERLRGLLNPFHLQVHSAVAAAFDKYVALSDMVSAAAACEHLCAFYRATYAPLCPAHPMLALQLFSLGDIYKSLAKYALDSGDAPPGGDEGDGPADSSSKPEHKFCTWRGSRQRNEKLASLFVSMEANLSKGQTDPPQSPCPVAHPFSAPPETAAAAASRWRVKAREVHCECAELLRVSYGPTHRLSIQLSEILRDPS